MRTVIVTGAGRGIGASIARKFLDLGDRVYGVDLAFDEAPREIVEAVCDITDPDAVRELVERVVRETGRVDVLVNNAGIRVEADVIDTTIEDWDRLMAVNLTAVFLACKFALPHMVEQGSGAIVSVASVAGLNPIPDRAAYCASKAGGHRADPADGASVRPPGDSGERGLSGSHPDALHAPLSGEVWRSGRGVGRFRGSPSGRAVRGTGGDRERDRLSRLRRGVVHHRVRARRRRRQQPRHRAREAGQLLRG